MAATTEFSLCSESLPYSGSVRSPPRERLLAFPPRSACARFRRPTGRDRRSTAAMMRSFAESESASICGIDSSRTKAASISTLSPRQQSQRPHSGSSSCPVKWETRA